MRIHRPCNEVLRGRSLGRRCRRGVAVGHTRRDVAHFGGTSFRNSDGISRKEEPRREIPSSHTRCSQRTNERNGDDPVQHGCPTGGSLPHHRGNDPIAGRGGGRFVIRNRFFQRHQTQHGTTFESQIHGSKTYFVTLS